MVDATYENEKLTFNVQVVTRASRTEIVGAHNGTLKIRIAAPPVDGAANEELIRALAKAFGVARSAVSLIRGQSSKLKVVTVEGGSIERLEEILDGII
jgi:uncharacterized protein